MRRSDILLSLEKFLIRRLNSCVKQKITNDRNPKNSNSLVKSNDIPMIYRSLHSMLVTDGKPYPSILNSFDRQNLSPSDLLVLVHLNPFCEVQRVSLS